MNPWWVIVNPAAGRGTDLRGRVDRALDRRDIEHTIRVSASADDVAGIVAEGCHSGHSRFVSVGGDGTAHLVVNALLDLPCPDTPTLAILPAGSGCDFARSFGLPGDVDVAAERLTGDRAVPVDVGRIEGGFGTRYFLNAANTGIAARTVVEAARLPARIGSRRYILGFWKALAGMRAGPVTVVADGRTTTSLAMNVVVANGRFFGGGMNVAPGAVLDDGLFDVQVIAGPRRNAPVVIRKIIHGTHLGHRSVSRVEASTVSVGVPDDWIVEADGEILGTGPFAVTVVRGRLHFTG